MPKSLRSAKRRHHEMSPTSSSSIASAACYSQSTYVSNVQMADGEDSIDDILSEMAGQQGITLSSSAMPSSTISTSITPITTATTIPKTLPVNETVSIEKEAEGTDTSNIKLFNTTIPTRPYTKKQVERIRSWNSIMNTWQRTGTFHNNPTVETGDGGIFVPSFDVEMTRHFKIQALSSYLLDTCKGLKMPAFERWYVTNFKSTTAAFVMVIFSFISNAAVLFFLFLSQ